MRWSYSLHGMMKRCQRQLVFAHVVASPTSKEPERHEAYLLKQLQQISAWQGNLVHKVLAREIPLILQTKQSLDASALTDRVMCLAQRQFAFSSAHSYRQPGTTKTRTGDDYCALFAHEYGQEITDNCVARASEAATLCFGNLISQKDFLHLLYAGSRHVAEPRLNVRFDGSSLMAVPDLVFASNDGCLSVVDWKIGNSETSDYTYQLLVYALAVVLCGLWARVCEQGLNLYEVNLLRNYVRKHHIDQERLREAEDFIYRSLVDLEAIVSEITYANLNLDDFEVAQRPTTCQYCNFNRLCESKFHTEEQLKGAAIVRGRLL